MKRLLFLVAMVATIATASNAQEWKFGGGLTLGTEMGIDDDGSRKMGFGLNLRADCAFNEKFSVAPGFTYFFPSTPEGFDLSAWQICADAHYIFLGEENFSLYGIGGLNYSYAKTEFDFLGVPVEDDNSEIGIDLGAGANFGSMFFGELKYDTAFEQVAITVGVLF